MIAYLLKSGACLILLLVVYHLFLEREKMPRFNRYFLLFSLIFSLTIPLLTIQIGTPSVSDYQLSNYIQEIQTRTTSFDQAPKSSTQNVTATTDSNAVDYYGLMVISYLVVSSILLIRLVRNLYGLFSTVRQNECILQDDVALVLVVDCNIPYSFFKYIFVDKNTYRSGKIDDTIITHELTHIRQKHSLDILFVELLKVVLWFNPIIYFYKKAIQLNHEFLADEAVIANNREVSAYQKLLLKMNSSQNKISLASSIQYSITKKRIIMMTKQSNRRRNLCKQLLLIPVLAGLVFAFSTRTAEAQNIEQMSITELMDAVYAKMQTLDSLSAGEKEELSTLLSKMQNELRGKPKPPVEAEKAPPPPKEIKIDTTDYNRAGDEYMKKVDAYLRISPIPENKEKLKRAYSEIQKAYKRLGEISSKIRDKNVPPPAPMPQNPTDRIQTHKQDELANEERAKLNDLQQKLHQKTQAYRQIKPDSSNIAQLKSAYKEMIESHNHFVAYQKDILGSEAPPPPPIMRDPNWRIKNNK